MGTPPGKSINFQNTTTKASMRFFGGHHVPELHTSTQDGQARREDEEEEEETALFLLLQARSRWCERLETSSGVGQPWANGKLCWQRRARAWNCLTASC